MIKLTNRSNTEFVFVREALTALPKIGRGDGDRVSSREISDKTLRPNRQFRLFYLTNLDPALACRRFSISFMRVASSNNQYLVTRLAEGGCAKCLEGSRHKDAQQLDLETRPQNYFASDTELSPAHCEFTELLKAEAVLTRRTKTD